MVFTLINFIISPNRIIIRPSIYININTILLLYYHTINLPWNNVANNRRNDTTLTP